MTAKTAPGYESTRGRAPHLGFDDVLLTGLAPDGGLYAPSEFPELSEQELAGLAGRHYGDVADAVMAPFFGDAVTPDRRRAMIDAAYGAFAHPAVAPLVQTGADDFLLELHHGPTLAFKDVAMQLLGHLFADRLAARGRRMTIVAATSGDTGGAAIDAMADRPGVGICVLHPEGRISEVQRRFMTTVAADNVLNIAVQGTFDDCQAMVKAMFADEAFRTEIALGAVNSINWARIVAQTVYYVSSSLSLGGTAARPINYCVPTGNFGDVFAGYVAKQMGAPIGHLVVATNENDILTRALTSGEYRPDGVVQTQSPSMDIQVSSNFERLLYLATGRDAAQTADMMAGLSGGQGFSLSPLLRERIGAGFSAYRTDEALTSTLMKAAYEKAGALIDPHTAVGLGAAMQARAAGLEGPLVTLSTAHAAKFPDAVEAATGQRPPLPPRCGDLFARDEEMVSAPNDLEHVKSVIRGRFSG